VSTSVLAMQQPAAANRLIPCSCQHDTQHCCQQEAPTQQTKLKIIWTTTWSDGGMLPAYNLSVSCINKSALGCRQWCAVHSVAVSLVARYKTPVLTRNSMRLCLCRCGSLVSVQQSQTKQATCATCSATRLQGNAYGHVTDDSTAAATAAAASSSSWQDQYPAYDHSRSNFASLLLQLLILGTCVWLCNHVHTLLCCQVAQ
jgi:hypothetical protein